MDINKARDMIKQAHLPEKTVDLCLRGDLQAELEDLQRRLQSISAGKRDSLADDGGGDAKAICDQMDALTTEMEEDTIPVKMRALPRKDWTKLLAEHPARKDNPGDRAMGMNVESFFDALIPKCWVEPAFEKDEITGLLDELTSAQYDKLQEAAWGLNRRDVNVPFSRNALRSMRPSAQTSKQQSG